jgi:hypothetical protein
MTHIKLGSNIQHMQMEYNIKRVSVKEIRIRLERLPDRTYIGQLTFFTVVHVWNGDLTLRHVVVVIDVIGQHTYVCETDKQSAQQAARSCKWDRNRKDCTCSVL